MTDESLAQFQTRFARDLIGTDLSSPAPFGTGYAIHARNVRNSLVVALKQSFPVTARLAGPHFFDQLARDFTLHHPPRLGWISAYGAELPDFLGKHACCASLPLLADIARIEWARVKVSFTDEAAGLDLALLASMPPDDLMEHRVALHPSATLIRSPHRVYAIWLRFQNPCGEETMTARDSEGDGDDIMVSRAADGQAAVIRLPRADAAFVAALASGRPLGMAWAAALDIDRHFDLATSLAELVRESALADGMS
jgi:hypothetical protein